MLSKCSDMNTNKSPLKCCSSHSVTGTGRAWNLIQEGAAFGVGLLLQGCRVRSRGKTQPRASSLEAVQAPFFFWCCGNKITCQLGLLLAGIVPKVQGAGEKTVSSVSLSPLPEGWQGMQFGG